MSSTDDRVARYLRDVSFVRMMSEPSPVAFALIALCLVVFIAIHAGSIALGHPAESGYMALVLTGAKLNGAVADGQWWRLLSSQFLHGGALHLLFNGYALYALGPLLERLYGSARFLVLYLGAGLVAQTTSYFLVPNASVGASGAIFGLLGAAVVYGFRFRRQLPEGVGPRLSRTLLPWVALNLVIGFTWPGIDNAAHLGGLVGGAVLAAVLPSRANRSETRRPMVGLAVLAAVLVLGSLVAMGVELSRCGRSEAQIMACYGDELAAMGSR